MKNLLNSKTSPIFKDIIPVKRHFGGVDILRTILCITVVALHCNPWYVPQPYDCFTSENPTWYRVLLFDWLWLAVPCFLTLSLYLFYRKAMSDNQYGLKRISYIFALACFWNFALTMVLNNGQIIDLFKGKNFISCFLILIANHNIAYFLFVQLFLTIIAWGICYFLRNRKCSLTLLIIMSVMLILSIVISFFGRGIFCKIFGTENGNNFGYSNILVYFPCLFVAFFLYVIFDVLKLSKKFIAITGCCLLGVFIILAIIDWQIQNSGSPILDWNYCATGRIQIPFACALLCLCALAIKKDSFPFFSWFSELTMGIFLTHTVIINYVGAIISKLSLSQNTLFLMLFVFTITLSTLLVAIVKYFSKKNWKLF
ncbi:MAG: acyltransferase family protein [Clostridia bacterium]|nr:acyltransferase family protein [Clostridia bacterium]